MPKIQNILIINMVLKLGNFISMNLFLKLDIFAFLKLADCSFENSYKWNNEEQNSNLSVKNKAVSLVSCF